MVETTLLKQVYSLQTYIYMERLNTGLGLGIGLPCSYTLV